MFGKIVQNIKDQIAGMIRPFESAFKTMWSNTLGSWSSWLSGDDAWNMIMNDFLGQDAPSSEEPQAGPEDKPEEDPPAQPSSEADQQADAAPEPADFSPHRDPDTTGAPAEFQRAATQAAEEEPETTRTPVPDHQFDYFAP